MSEPRKREEKIGPSLRRRRGYVVRGRRKTEQKREGLEERSRLEEMGKRGRRMADEYEGEKKSGDGERRKIESARKTKR